MSPRLYKILGVTLLWWFFFFYHDDSEKGKSFVTLCAGKVLEVVIKEGRTWNGAEGSVSLGMEEEK